MNLYKQNPARNAMFALFRWGNVLFYAFLFSVLFSSISYATLMFSDTFTAADNTPIDNYNGWSCSLNATQPGTAITNNRMNISQNSSLGYSTCEHNISFNSQVDNTLINLSILLLKAPNANIIFALCNVSKSGSKYCGLDSAGNYGSMGYYFEVQPPTTITIGKKTSTGTGAPTAIGTVTTSSFDLEQFQGSTFRIIVQRNNSNQTLRFYIDEVLELSVNDNTMNHTEAKLQ